MKPKHVCHVINSLARGGAEHYVVQVANYVAAAGTRVSIVAGDPYLIDSRRSKDVHLERLSFKDPNNRSLFAYLSTLSRSVRHLVRFFRNEGVSIVHTHLASSALPAWIAAKLCRIPVIHSKMYVSPHGSQFEKIMFRSRIPPVLVGWFLAFSRYAGTEIEQLWHVPKERILHSSIGVDTDRFAPRPVLRAEARTELNLSQDDKVMLVVARLHPEKDVGLAIRAAKALDDPEAILLLAGDGPQLEEMSELAASLPGRTRIRFLGALDDTTPAFAAADLLLQTTRGPNIGIAVLEAFASGVPVLIAYRDEAERAMATDTLEDQPIGAVADASPAAMAAAVAELFDDPEQLAKLGANARAFAIARHGQDHVLAGMLHIYARLERQN